MLKQWYFKDQQSEVNTLKVWQDTCHYLYLPRLLNEQVFKDTIAKGLPSDDYFGYSAGKEGDKYLGFVFEKSGRVMTDSSSLLIDAEAAIQYQASLVPPTPLPIPDPIVQLPSSPCGGTVTASPPVVGPGPTPPPPPVQDQTKKHFYGTIELDPIKAIVDFSTLVNEVIQHFSSKPGVNLTISIEIEADSAVGFDESLQRIIKENTRVLKFKQAEFEA